MRLEAIGKSLTYRWPGGEVVLEPGKPVELPRDRAERLLAKAAGKVREVKPDWFAAWRALAALVYGIEREDPRYEPVMAGLNTCDVAFLSGDWSAFRRAAEHVQALVRAKG